MKKNLLALVAFCAAFALLLSACNKDDYAQEPTLEEAQVTEIVLDGFVPGDDFVNMVANRPAQGAAAYSMELINDERGFVVHCTQNCPGIASLDLANVYVAPKLLEALQNGRFTFPKQPTNCRLDGATTGNNTILFCVQVNPCPGTQQCTLVQEVSGPFSFARCECQ